MTASFFPSPSYIHVVSWGLTAAEYNIVRCCDRMHGYCFRLLFLSLRFVIIQVIFDTCACVIERFSVSRSNCVVEQTVIIPVYGINRFAICN
jgi:hypothetical protein